MDLVLRNAFMAGYAEGWEDGGERERAVIEAEQDEKRIEENRREHRSKRSAKSKPPPTPTSER